MTRTVSSVGERLRQSRPSEPSSVCSVPLEPLPQSSRLHAGSMRRRIARGDAPALDASRAARGNARSGARRGVAISTVTPTSLKRLNSFMTSTRELGIEVAGGLVGDQERGLADHRAGDADALLLAGRELERPERSRPSRPTWSSAARTRLSDLLLRHAGDDERQRDVVVDRAVVSSLWSWKTMPIWRRKAGICARGTSAPVFWPLTSTVPRVGRSMQRDELEHACSCRRPNDRSGTPSRRARRRR